ncbi:MAG: FkbM family methyltransferase [Polyangiales bacterium]
MSSADVAVQSVIADGDYGVFEGSPRDRVVMDEYRRLGSWAPDLVSLVVERLFSRGRGTFIDVGANIGLVCIPVVERSRAQAICFEPEPQNFDFLTRNVARHQLDARITCHPLACHSAAGQLPLALSPDNLGDHRLQRVAADEALDPAESRTLVMVRTTRLDDVLRGVPLTAPVVMKVDAQGSEVGVFDGAVETLARCDHLISEYWPRGIVDHGDSARAFESHAIGFPYGAVLRVLPLPEPLHPSRYVFDQLSWIKNDGSDPGFFDLLFSRHPQLPAAAGH